MEVEERGELIVIRTLLRAAFQCVTQKSILSKQRIISDGSVSTQLSIIWYLWVCVCLPGCTCGLFNHKGRKFRQSERLNLLNCGLFFTFLGQWSHCDGVVVL